MGRLGGGDEGDAVSGQSGCLGGSGDAGELWKGGQVVFSGAAHLGIGFHPENGIAIFQQHAGENAGAGSDVGDGEVRGQSTIGVQEVDDSGG